MRDGTLAARHFAERVKIEAHARAQARSDAAEHARLPASPAGRRALRGIPCVGTGGLDERRNPLDEILDRERDAEAARALAALGQ